MNVLLHPDGSVCWVDLGVDDTAAAAAFYGRLFGWRAEPADGMGYLVASLGGRPVAGLGPAEDPGRPYWTVYVQTSDIHATVEAVGAAGGTVAARPSPAADAAVIAVVRDHDGGQLSLWEPIGFAGTHTSGAHGTVAGVRLQISSLEQSQEFLGAVLDWRPLPDGTIVCDGRTVATWMPKPLGGSNPAPSPWLVNFFVDDVEAAKDCALRLGASVVAGETQVLVDPAGARFGLVAVRRDAGQVGESAGT